MPPAVQQLIDRLGGARNAMIALVGVAAVVLILLVSRWATTPTLVPLAAGLPLESVSQYQDKLTQAGIVFELDETGTGIRVAAPDLARARVTLAKGGMPNQGRPGMELFDQPSWAMTDFTQRINYRRALEGELERTIGKMRGVEAAQVHLAMQETSAFRSSDRPVEASVVLKLRSGEEPGAEVVQGIAHLVAASVDGLQPERVTVVDDGGRLLSNASESGSPESLTSRQLAMQKEVEDHFRHKAEEIVEQMVGRGNSRVQVSATLNFDKVERTSLTMDPEKQVTASEQKAEIVPGAQGGAGSTNTATAYENSKSTETFSGAVGGLRRLTVAVLVNDRMVPVPPAAKTDKKADRQDVAAAPERRAVPRDSAELARIDELVRGAVGFDSSRGDMVRVINATFDVPAIEPVEAPSPSITSRLHEFQRLIIATLGLIFAFAVALLALKAIRSSPRAEAEAAALAAATAHAQLGSGTESEPPLIQTIPPRAIAANALVRERVVATVEEQPDVAAKLVRAWMKE